MTMQSSGRAPTLGAIAEQTKSSWARLITSYAAVPPVYQGFFEPLQVEGRAFPHTVVTPSYEKFLHRTTEKLVCEFGHEVHVLERSGSTFEALSFPLEEISYVQVRTMLLDSHIQICGVTKQGVPACCTLRFNSITDYLFRPIVERIRRATFDARDQAPSSERATFDYLVRVNYKFMSYARHSLLAGEKVIHTILQPEIRERVLTVLGKTYYRTVFPTHMSILTDRELIMIGEEHRRGGEDRYGGIWDYIPLHKIVALSLSSKGSNLLSLSIQLPDSTCLDYLFEASARREVEQLLDLAKELTP
jgi:hypothetical protein